MHATRAVRAQAKPEWMPVSTSRGWHDVRRPHSVRKRHVFPTEGAAHMQAAPESPSVRHKAGGTTLWVGRCNRGAACTSQAARTPNSALIVYLFSLPLCPLEGQELSTASVGTVSGLGHLRMCSKVQVITHVVCHQRCRHCRTQGTCAAPCLTGTAPRLTSQPA